MQSQRGPILIIEDDSSDAEAIVAAVGELKFQNEVKRFAQAKDAIEYLMVTSDQPLVIISDVRMPGLDGISLLSQIQETEFLRLKAIPFVFLTGIITKDIVNKAYDLGVQGFYEKSHTYEGIKEQLYFILSYWKRSIHPNTPSLL